MSKQFVTVTTFHLLATAPALTVWALLWRLVRPEREPVEAVEVAEVRRLCWTCQVTGMVEDCPVCGQSEV